MRCQLVRSLFAERAEGLFRIASWHEAAGVWLDDLLRPARPLWLVDAGLEVSAPEGLTVAMRVFDAGPFHAGFGIVVMPDDDLAGLCVTAASQGDRLPMRTSLAVGLYGEEIVRRSIGDPDDYGERG